MGRSAVGSDIANRADELSGNQALVESLDLE